MAIQPRLLDDENAAAYLTITEKDLKKVPVSPVFVGGKKRYDRAALDYWLDRESGIVQDAGIDQFSAWQMRRASKG